MSVWSNPMFQYFIVLAALIIGWSIWNLLSWARHAPKTNNSEAEDAG